jgi:hypothetical protein
VQKADARSRCCVQPGTATQHAKITGPQQSRRVLISRRTHSPWPSKRGRLQLCDTMHSTSTLSQQPVAPSTEKRDHALEVANMFLQRNRRHGTSWDSRPGRWKSRNTYVRCCCRAVHCGQRSFTTRSIAWLPRCGSSNPGYIRAFAPCFYACAALCAVSQLLPLLAVGSCAAERCRVLGRASAFVRGALIAACRVRATGTRTQLDRQAIPWFWAVG